MLDVPPEEPPATFAARPGRLAAALGPAGSDRRRVVVNGLWTSGVFLASAVVMFFLSPFVVRSLGDAGYGVWEIALGVTGYLGFADLGVRPAIVYFVARHDARDEPREVNRYVSSALVTFGVCGALILLASWLVAPHVPRWFHVDGASAGEATTAVLVTGASLALTLPLNAFSAVVVGKQRYGLLGAADLVVLAAKSAATVAVLRAGLGLVALAWVTFGADVLEMGLKAGAAFRIERRLAVSPRLASWDRCRSLLGYAGVALLVNLSLLVIWKTDALVIGATLSAEAVTLFTVGSKLPTYARSLTTAASRVLTPAATRLEALGDHAGLLRMLARASRGMLLVGGAILAYLLGVGEPFLATWQGERFRGEGAAVLAALTIGAVGPIAAYPFEAVLYGARKMGVLAVLSVVEAAANLVASVLLAKPLGIVGVALGTTVPGLLIRLVALPWWSARAFDGRFLPLALRAWTTPLLATALTVLLLRLVVDPSSTLGWPTLAALAVGTQVVFLALHEGLARLAPRALRVETLPVPPAAAATAAPATAAPS